MTLATLSAAAYRDALKAVIDPEIFQNIVDLGLVYHVTVADPPTDQEPTGDDVTVTMTLTSPHCPMGPQIMQDVEQTLLKQGAANVTIDLVWQPAWTPDAMAEELKRELGILDREEEPELEIDLMPPPPPAPPKKQWLPRLFRGLFGG